MSSSVRSLVPKDMTLQDAIGIMQSEGFECEVERDSQFLEASHWADTEPVHKNIDFIRCRRANSNAGFLMARI